MDLNFSQKGLFIFDASTLSKGLECSSESSDELEGILLKFLEHVPCVRSINLSKNSIYRFTGGETLKTVTVLDLSFNSLTSLQSSSLPPALVKLNLFHNRITRLDALDQFLPLLEDLNAGQNALTSTGIRSLPGTLINLNLQSNELEDLTSIATLNRLVKLDVSKNRLETPDELRVLTHLRHLRHLNIQDNPLTQGNFDLQNMVRNVAPWLLNFNGASLLHVGNGNMYKGTNVKSREENTTLEASQNRSNSTQRVSADPSTSSSRSTAERRTRPQIKKQPMEMLLVETKVKELEKMLAESQKAEEQALKQRELLLDQVKGCGKVIQDQAEQLEMLQKTISTLKKDEETLKKSTLEAERAFEQTHASLLTHRINNSFRS